MLTNIQRMSHLRLLLRRRIMISMTYDYSTAALCGSIATDIVSKLKVHELEIAECSSFRFHMATTLGGAILILATLLTRSLSSLGLQDNRPLYAESFQDGVKLLKDLGINLPAARRVANDLEDIIKVVTSILDQQSLSSPESGFSNYVPPNMDSLFPYTAIDFMQQDELPDELLGEFIDNTGDSMMQPADWGYYNIQPTTNGYSVAWI